MNSDCLKFPHGPSDTWDEMDKMIFGDFSNKERILQLSKDASSDIDDSFPDQGEDIIPHSALIDATDEHYGKRKGRRLRRRNLGYDEFGDDHRYSAFKYEQFYKDFEPRKETFQYESFLKSFLEEAGESREEPYDLSFREAPRYSMISAGKQKMYLRLKTKLTKASKEDDEVYKLFKLLQKVVQKEQRDYVAYCLRQAKYTKIIDYETVLPGLISYIERTLFHRQQSIPTEYEALYHLHSVIDFAKPFKKEILFQPVTLLSALGQVPFTDTSSNFYTGVSLEELANELEFLVPSNNQLGHLAKGQSGPCIYKTPVSYDPNANHFAVETDAEIVTCSSVMELLVDVHPYSLQNSATRRDIPVLVKMMKMPDGSEKKVVFMDKALPPLEMTLYDKKVWACKRAVKELFSSWDLKTFRFSDLEEVAKSSGVTDEEEDNLMIDVEMFDEDDEDDNFPLQPPQNQNVAYGLYNFGESNGTGRQINVVVRSSYHAYEKKNGKERPYYLHFSVKLEHQPEYGAQCTTISEVSREWMALKLRKGSNLARVRVDANTLKVIQVEKKNMKSLQRECKMRGMNIENRVASLHHTFDELTKLEPGSYLFQLIPIEGLGRLLEQDTTGTNLRGGSFFNLHLHYRRSNHVIGPTSHVPYSMIDPSVATPYHIKNNRIPATFMPKENIDKSLTVPSASEPGSGMLNDSKFEEDLDFEGHEEYLLEMNSDGESLEEWVNEDETRNVAKRLEEEMEHTEEEKEAEKEPEKQDTFLMPNREDPDIMRIIMEMQVHSPVSALGSIMGSSVVPSAAPSMFG